MTFNRTTKYALAVFFAVTMSLVTASNAAYAAKPSEPTTEIPTGDGKLIPVPGKQKHDVSIQASNRLKTFSWTDCGGVVRSGQFTTYFASYPTNQVTYTWSWPSVSKGGLVCDNISFSWMYQQLQDVTRGWTVYSAKETSYVNSLGKTYNIADTNGNPLYVYYLDTVNSQENACYGEVFGVCTISKWFSTGNYQVT